MQLLVTLLMLLLQLLGGQHPSPGIASRVVIRSLDIDLPVVAGKASYPSCDVAMYMGDQSQPGEPGITYIYAHAQPGMFWPLLQKVRAHKDLVGLKVQVYTTNSLRYDYEVYRVNAKATRWPTTRYKQILVLQTSTGPHGTIPKLILKARLTGPPHLVSHRAANPAPHPRDCAP